MEIKITKTTNLKSKPPQENLGFGQYFTDHMFVMDYDNGWRNPEIVPYSPIMLDPSCMSLHYGQGMFEGLKAYRAADGRILLFRPERNMARMNVTNDRLCIPQIDEEFALKALKTLVEIDQDWIPTEPDTSLYIRPFIVATDPFLGVRPSLTYKFIIILSPVGAYYPEGLAPVKIFVEDDYVRAVRGGIGYTKTPGNYAASIRAQQKAKELGFTQVLWLDGVERKYVEEVGTMNIFFKINGEIITPSLDGSILAGITRESVIAMLKSWDYSVTERKISIQEVFDAYKSGALEEVFGTGTAAVISPVGALKWEDKYFEIAEGKTGELSQKIYSTLTDLQNGRIEDTFGWTVEI